MAKQGRRSVLRSDPAFGGAAQKKNATQLHADLIDTPSHCQEKMWVLSRSMRRGKKHRNHFRRSIRTSKVSFLASVFLGLQRLCCRSAKRRRAACFNCPGQNFAAKHGRAAKSGKAYFLYWAVKVAGALYFILATVFTQRWVDGESDRGKWPAAPWKSGRCACFKCRTGLVERKTHRVGGRAWKK